ncbi:Ig domain-containing protein [Hyalangium versicolor]|uniref:Ig domain-containing protein n=1 Tax=Hyalangium versicolor TaxID=2861190 RepID=UPI001CC9243F|nr:Ig domain-containing protein [Hyalangium versicolor]
MNSRGVLLGLGLLGAMGLTFACQFAPDLSRFESCADNGSCNPGFTCLHEARRCLPDCGALGPCPIEEPPDASSDAGPDEDGGSDAGPDGGSDGGSDGGTDAGTDGGMDAGVPFSLLTERLPLAIEQTPYTADVQAQGGIPPYQFRATEALPEWLTLDGGTLSGTPPRPGTFRVAVEASDTNTPPSQQSATYTSRVRAMLRLAGPAILVDGYSGTFYTEKISATGGVPPYSFKVVSSNGPAGVTLLLDGSVTGTPSSTGTYTSLLQVTDSDPDEPQVATRTVTLSVTGSPLLLAFSTESLPDARMGTPYQYVLRVAPSSNVTWKLKAGALPGGIGFNPDTATLSGTPNVAPGNYTVTFNATDGLLGNVDRTFTITVH